MKITNEPLLEGLPVKFIVSGFPEEEAIKSSIERFYNIKAGAHKKFIVYNTFKEEIFTGKMGDGGKIEEFTVTPKQGKPFNGESKLQ
jgi:hypothetical protein